MQPFRATFDHPLAFGGQLAKVRGEHRRRYDSLGHCEGPEQSNTLFRIVVVVAKRAWQEKP